MGLELSDGNEIRRSVALERPVNRDCGGTEASVISRGLLA